MNNEEDFELVNALLDLKPMKIFECRSDAWMFMSENDDASWGALMKKLQLGVMKCMVEWFAKVNEKGINGEGSGDVDDVSDMAKIVNMVTNIVVNASPCKEEHWNDDVAAGEI